MKRQYRIKKQSTETSRQKTADVNNYSTQGKKDNRVFKDRLSSQQKRDKESENKKLMKSGVKKEDLPK